MRISDWSSDVCSSDLRSRSGRAGTICATPSKRRNPDSTAGLASRRTGRVATILPAIRREGERCRADAETASLAPDQTLTQLVFFHSSCLAPPPGLFCPPLNLPVSVSVFAPLGFLTSEVGRVGKGGVRSGRSWG